MKKIIIVTTLLLLTISSISFAQKYPVNAGAVLIITIDFDNQEYIGRVYFHKNNPDLWTFILKGNKLEINYDRVVKTTGFFVDKDKNGMPLWFTIGITRFNGKVIFEDGIPFTVRSGQVN